MNQAYRDNPAAASAATSLDSVWEHALRVAGRRQQRRRQAHLARQRAGHTGAPVLRAQPAPVSNTQRQGAGAERRALALLQGAGLRLVAANVRCRAGELDLVMHHGNTLVFVEVRARRSHQFTHGGALASVGEAKRRRLLVAAAVFLQQYTRRTGTAPPCRFDVVTFDGPVAAWHRGAFHGQGGGR